MGREECGVGPEGVGECCEGIITPLPYVWKNHRLGEVPLPTLGTLELSPYLPSLFIPWVQGSILFLRKNSASCLPEGLFLSLPLDPCLWAGLQACYLEAQGLAVALGLGQSSCQSESFDFHTSIAKGRLCPCPGIVLIPWPQLLSAPAGRHEVIPPPDKWLIDPTLGWHPLFSPPLLLRDLLLLIMPSTSTASSPAFSFLECLHMTL